MFLEDLNFYWQLVLVPLIIYITFGVLNGHLKEMKEQIFAEYGDNAVINMIDQFSPGAILSLDLSDRVKEHETSELSESIHVS